ncbi:hypothetical protein OXT66_07855 [Lentilactobacillus senioris]|uniref:hypothetical protein n=1 Tax=Lentilactobacillus senioris TaxID=931534 RepID=UPI0022809833|nr:hypothetical protein [Lentilactobacillus senioris]MCY9807446.1 hypothetical protein [Lentilactobacillus senioris]
MAIYYGLQDMYSDGTVLWNGDRPFIDWSTVVNGKHFDQPGTLLDFDISKLKNGLRIKSSGYYDMILNGWNISDVVLVPFYQNRTTTLDIPKNSIVENKSYKLPRLDSSLFSDYGMYDLFFKYLGDSKFTIQSSFNSDPHSSLIYVNNPESITSWVYYINIDSITTY